LSSPPLRVGVIGVGFGRVHLEAFRAIPGVELAAVCSRTRAKAEAVAEEFAVPGVFTEAAALIESGLDVVVVAAPNREHHPMTLAALEAGCHVLCEKPLAASVAEAREMVAAAEAAGRLLAVHMNRRMQPAVLGIREAHEAGELGEVDFVRATWLRQRGIPPREGFLTEARAGGGCLLDLGVHMLDQALFVQGYPRVTEVQARLHRRHFDEDVPELPSDVEDGARAFLTLEGGGAIALEIAWATPHHRAEARTLEVYGSRGGARRVVEGDGEDDAFFSLHARGGDVADQGTPSTPCPTIQQDLVDAIRDGRDPVAPGHQGLAMMEILEALYESARRGAAVRLGEPGA
jgi:predicted dehydrogenase